MRMRIKRWLKAAGKQAWAFLGFLGMAVGFGLFIGGVFYYLFHRGLDRLQASIPTPASYSEGWDETSDGDWKFTEILGTSPYRVQFFQDAVTGTCYARFFGDVKGTTHIPCSATDR